MALCERCLAELRNPRDFPPFVRSTENIIQVGDRIVPIRGTGLEILGILWRRRPGWVKWQTLLHLAWGRYAAAERDAVSVRVSIYHLRRLLLRVKAPVTIVGRFGYGYTLVESDTATRPVT